MSMFNINLDGFPNIKKHVDAVDTSEIDFDIDDPIFLDNFENILKSLTDISNAVVYFKYEILLQCLPNHLEPPSLSDTLLKPCCANLCCYQFSPDCIMRCRLLLPVNHGPGESSFDQLQKTHFLLLKLCLVENAVVPKICNVSVCTEFFRRVYSIPKRRYDRLYNQILLHFDEPTPHGNFGRLRESRNVLNRIGSLVNAVAKLSEIRPDGKGYQFPSSMTKKDVMDFCISSQPKKINPSIELGRLSGRFHFHKKNDMTKCNTCLKYKAGLNSKRFRSEFVQEARMHLNNHYLNTQLDRRDYYTRMQCSRDSDDLLSIAHDGFSKEATKFPHLLDERLKSLTDATKMMCSLNIAVVHKKYKCNIDAVGTQSHQEQEYVVGNGDSNKDFKDQLHAFWNVGQIHGSESNVLISQLFYTISHCSNIPSEISIQLDNCASNKSYTVLGAFGLPLLWIPDITKIYLCYPEVGHTHDDVDRYFSCLARPLRRKAVYSPFDFQRFLDKHLHGVITNTLTPPVYDFDGVVASNVVHNKNLKNYHYFELSKDANGEVVIRIARFVRSEMFLQKSVSSGPIFKLFKEVPNLESFPIPVGANDMNIEQFTRLSNAVEKAIPLEKYEELLTLPNFIQNSPPPEPFISLIERCRAKVLPKAEAFRIIPDPENTNLNAFLNNPAVWKPWRISPISAITEPVASVSNESPTLATTESTSSTTEATATEQVIEIANDLHLNDQATSQPENPPQPQQLQRLSTLRKRKPHQLENPVKKKRGR